MGLTAKNNSMLDSFHTSQRNIHAHIFCNRLTLTFQTHRLLHTHSLLLPFVSFACFCTFPPLTCQSCVQQQEKQFLVLLFALVLFQLLISRFLSSSLRLLVRLLLFLITLFHTPSQRSFVDCFVVSFAAAFCLLCTTLYGYVSFFSIVEIHKKPAPAPSPELRYFSSDRGIV